MCDSATRRSNYNSMRSAIEINTRYVKRKDLKSVRELLHPRWRGKMAFMDPTVPGTGNARATAFYVHLGQEFVRKLYVDQRPIMTRNRRQLADWLARGTYPLVSGAPQRAIERLKEEGFPVASIHSFTDFGGMVGAGSGIMTLMNKAPHPNAARVLVNWLASKEGLEFFSRINQTPTTRSDVDESFIPAEQIPRPGVSYLDTSDWNYAITKDDVRLRMRKFLK